MNLQREAMKRLPMLPGRVVSGGPRNGANLGSASQQAGDLFWRCAVECFKPVYTRIDLRFSAIERAKDDLVSEKHRALMDEAKKILQEHRNLIFECVLPMFVVRSRANDEASSEADSHVADYFCRNVFPVMIDTLVASLPSFVATEDVETTGQHIRNLADVQSKRLEAQLLNFSFQFRPVLTPQQANRKGNR
jgi:hypothetical protein